MSSFRQKAGSVLVKLGQRIAPVNVAAAGKIVLPLKYDYRASESGEVNLHFLQAGTDVAFHLHAMNFAGVSAIKGEPCLRCRLPAVKRGDTLCVSLTQPTALLNGAKLVAEFVQKRVARKFISEMAITTAGLRQSRLCSHYLPFDNKPVGSDYYFGDDYVDYPRQTAALDGVARVKEHCPNGRLLDIGCALGIHSKAFLDAGFDVHGMDISEFAIGEAAKRVGAERVRCASLDTADIPFAGSFDVFWMWDVLEHLSGPEEALAKVTRRAKAGAMLFLHTSNADSLTHRIFGKDWEGYTDYSHHGVDQVTCTNLRAWLGQFGWDIVGWECRSIWVEGVDPVVMRLKEVFQKSAELQVLLDEAELGDAIGLVARKR